MQEHTKKPAISHNKAGNYPMLFGGVGFRSINDGGVDHMNFNVEDALC